MRKLKTTTSDPRIERIIQATIKWHAERCRALKDMIAIGDDDEIVVAGADGRKIALSAQQRSGFKAGASVALSLFESLPLKVAKEEKHGS